MLHRAVCSSCSCFVRGASPCSASPPCLSVDIMPAVLLLLGWVATALVDQKLGVAFHELPILCASVCLSRARHPNRLLLFCICVSVGVLLLSMRHLPYTKVGDGPPVVRARACISLSTSMHALSHAHTHARTQHTPAHTQTHTSPCASPPPPPAVGAYSYVLGRRGI